MKSQVLHTVWCNISGEAVGEIWNWTLFGAKGSNAKTLTPLTIWLPVKLSSVRYQTVLIWQADTIDLKLLHCVDTSVLYAPFPEKCLALRAYKFIHLYMHLGWTEHDPVLYLSVAFIFVSKFFSLVVRLWCWLCLWKSCSSYSRGWLHSYNVRSPFINAIQASIARSYYKILGV